MFSHPSSPDQRAIGNQRTSWDIFCRVVDNYGDIGVCWRLARQLAHEYPLRVRLWVDDLTPLTQIYPAARLVAQQRLENVDVNHWPATFNKDATAADVVIEAFACELPETYLAAMKARSIPPLWINLEYLSAEQWIEACHRMQSVHPRLGLTKFFFFPGFTANTGGLLREQSLLDDYGNFDAPAKAALLQRLSVDSPDGKLVSLFGYDNAAVGSLLTAWQAGPEKLTCLIPTGKILASVNAHLGTALQTGDKYLAGNLKIVVLPFLSQTDYDRLLWACDINFVRGEDSFVRAQWAAKPFIWHIYPQEEDAHQVKLEAFLERYTRCVDPPLDKSLKELWQNWNTGGDCAPAWRACLDRYSEWAKRCRSWRQEQVCQEDLAQKLVQFSEKTL